MVYSLEAIQQIIAPVAEKYRLPAVYIFGSYARHEATEASDIDLLIDGEGSEVKSLFDLGGLCHDLRAVLHKEVDLVTVRGLEQERGTGALFVDNVINDGVMLFERA